MTHGLEAPSMSLCQMKDFLASSAASQAATAGTADKKIAIQVIHACPTICCGAA